MNVVKKVVRTMEKAVKDAGKLGGDAGKAMLDMSRARHVIHLKKLARILQTKYGMTRDPLIYNQLQKVFQELAALGEVP